MSIRILEAIKTVDFLQYDQIDFIAAYSNGQPDVAIFMIPPEGYCSNNMILILWKALYSLKQLAYH
jgi:hypothetical protein